MPGPGAGENFAVAEDGVADDFFPRIVGWRAVAVASEHAEIVARHHNDIDPLDVIQDVVDHADTRRTLDLNHDQDVVVGIGVIPIAPQDFGLVVSRRAAPSPGLGIRVVPMTDRIL